MAQGFTDAQVQALYGNPILEMFITHKLVDSEHSG